VEAKPQGLPTSEAYHFAGQSVPLQFTPKPDPDGWIATEATINEQREIQTSLEVLGFRVGGNHIQQSLAKAYTFITALEKTVDNGHFEFRVGQDIWWWTLFVQPCVMYMSCLFTPIGGFDSRFDKLQARALFVHARLGAYSFTAFSRSAVLYLFGHKKLSTQWKISQMNLLMSIQLQISREEALAAYRHSRVQDPLIPTTGRAPLYRLFLKTAQSGLKATSNDTNLQTASRFARYSIAASLLHTYEECMGLPAAPHEEMLDSHDDDDDVEDRPTDWPGDRDMRLRVNRMAARFRSQQRKQLLEDIQRTTSTAMLSAFQVTSKWRKQVLFQLESGAATSAFLAVALPIWRRWLVTANLTHSLVNI